MKVYLNGTYCALARNLSFEGEEIVTSPSQADIAVVEEFEEGLPSFTIGAGFRCPEAFLEELQGLRFSDPNTPIENPVVAFRWFELDRWQDQTLVGIPLRTLMDRGLGASCPAGIVCCYCHDGVLTENFDQSILVDTLKEMHFRGFVSFLYEFKERDLFVREISTKVPFWGFYAAIEGITGRIIEFLTGRTPILRESWTAALLISRTPFPLSLQAPKVFVGGVEPEVEKHFWFWDLNGYRKSFYTESPILGVATAWSLDLGEVCRRTLRTTRNLEIPGKQHRTDMLSVGSGAFRELEAEGVL